MTKLTSIFDYDLIAYRAASAGETRTIKAYHPITGDEWSCKTRTELYGHWQKKDKGLLAEHNKLNGTEYKADELVITDIQTPEKIANVLHTAKSMVESALYQLKTNKHICYIGVGESFRVERSTLIRYKGNRTGMIKPLALDEVTAYLTKKFSAIEVSGIEADDAVVMEAYRDKTKTVVAVDKDYLGTDVLLFNPNKPEQGTVDCSGYGSLWLDNKGAVTGKGRSFLYYQTLSQDDSDNYAANSASDVKWGSKSAYEALKDCTNDKEALQAIADSYKLLYPETKMFKGWRGDEFEIDWKYVFNENWDMARMLRWEGDVVVGTDVLLKLGVIND